MSHCSAAAWNTPVPDCTDRHDAGRYPQGVNIISRWRVCEVWMGVCAVGACVAALTGAPSAGTAATLVGLSCIPVAGVLLWWPSETTPAIEGAQR